MREGDIVEWKGILWGVQKVEAATRTAILRSPSAGQHRELVAEDLDQTCPTECKVVCHPSEEWPFVSVQSKNSWGSLNKIYRVFPDPSMAPLVLTPLRDWYKPDEFRQGAPLYLHPSFPFKVGDALRLSYDKGEAYVRIPKGFATFSQKQARKIELSSRKSPQTIFDHLLDDPLGEDE